MAQSSVDADPLPGPAQSWAPGEPIPSDMPNASGSGSGVTKEIADLQKQKIETSDKLSAGMVGTLDADAQRLKHAYEQEGAALHDPALRPWNEDAEQAKHHTDPIMAFGSLGSVFGILASAFTHAPMENALNASASAINAIKQNDRQGFEDARKAWEANQKLALERQKIEHELYGDAATLLKTNLAAGEAKLKVLAARFDDRKMLALLNAGMSQEVLQYLDAKETVAGKMRENAQKNIEANAEMSFIMEKTEEHTKAGMPPRQARVKAFQEWQDEQARVKRESSPYSNRTSAAASEAEFVARRKSEAEANGLPWTSDDELRARSDYSKAHAKPSATTLTPDRQRAQDVNDIVEKYKKDNPDATPEQIAEFRANTEKRLKTMGAAITGNRMDDLVGKAGQVKQAVKIIDQLDAMLQKHGFITGLGGTITRPPEIIGNVLGSNSTDREQFKRFTEELRMLAPRILLDSKGRPISAEAERINTVVAGISPGDTSANTMRALFELRDQMLDIAGRLQERMGGGGSSTAMPPAKPQGEPAWKKAPLVRP